MSDFSTAKTVRARKQHECCECGIAIPSGGEYERVFGVWESYPGTFKTCLACVQARSVMLDALRVAGIQSWEYAFYYQGLHEELPNVWHDTGALSVGRELVLFRRRERAARVRA